MESVLDVTVSKGEESEVSGEFSMRMGKQTTILF